MILTKLSTYRRYIWGAICAKIKIHEAFIFTVEIYEIHNGNLLKSSLGGHVCSEIC